MSYDDDYEDEDMVMATAATAESLPPVKVSFEVSPERMAHEIAQNVRIAVGHHFKATVEKTVQSAVTELVDNIAREQIDAAVRQVLEEGWVVTDNYGSPTGTKSLKARISDMLNHRNYNNQGYGAELITKTVHEAMSNNFADEIKRLRDGLRVKVDTMLGEKVAGAVRDAIGLR